MSQVFKFNKLNPTIPQVRLEAMADIIRVKDGFPSSSKNLSPRQLRCTDFQAFLGLTEFKDIVRISHNRSFDATVISLKFLGSKFSEKKI